MIFVPPRFAADSILEAEDAGIETIIAITEGIPAHDELRVYTHLKRNPNVRLIGPNCPGVLSPGKASVGIIPASFFKEGNVGVVSRSGTLTYQIGNELAQRGFGNSSIVGIGGDPVPGSSFVDIIGLFQDDPETELIVMSGEIGGDAEERAAEFIAEHVTKPVVGYIAGFTAPPGKTMGHAGAIVSGTQGTAVAKAEALESKGVRRRAHPDRGRRHRHRDPRRLSPPPRGASARRSIVAAARAAPTITMSDESPLSPDLSATLAELESKLGALEDDLATARETPPPAAPQPPAPGPGAAGSVTAGPAAAQPAPPAKEGALPAPAGAPAPAANDAAQPKPAGTAPSPGRLRRRSQGHHPPGRPRPRRRLGPRRHLRRRAPRPRLRSHPRRRRRGAALRSHPRRAAPPRRRPPRAARAGAWRRARTGAVARGAGRARVRALQLAGPRDGGDAGRLAGRRARAGHRRRRADGRRDPARGRGRQRPPAGGGRAARRRGVRAHSPGGTGARPRNTASRPGARSTSSPSCGSPGSPRSATGSPTMPR